MAGSARPVVFVSHDRIGPSMAGPGIRYWELARVVARHCPVRVAAPAGSRPPDDGPDLVCYDPSRLETLWPLIQPARALVVQAPLLDGLPALAALRLPLAIDLYDPTILEDLERARQDPRLIPPVAEWRQRWLSLFQAGDFFLCASERQRDLWLGMLLLAGRVNRWTYGHDPTLRRLIDVVPMGLPATPPPRGGGLKGRQPGIAPTDRVVLWGGGLWDWLDPLTLVRAVPQVVARHPTLRVVFLGTRHPNPRVSPMAVVEAVRTLARDLGLLDRHVFFIEWVPYAERARLLGEADVGVSLHSATLEAHYAYRVRLLDYLWAGLPMVVTAGDVLSAEIAQEGLGIAVPPGDVDAVARALNGLLDQPDLRERLRPRFQEVAARHTWERVAGPLIRFCQAPALAPDRAALLSEASSPDLATAATLVHLRERLERLQEENDRLRAENTALRNGRVMRVLFHLESWRRRWRR